MLVVQQLQAVVKLPIESSQAAQPRPISKAIDNTDTLPCPPVGQLVLQAGVLVAGALFGVEAEGSEAHAGLLALVT